jgi:hypothetical protein
MNVANNKLQTINNEKLEDLTRADEDIDWHKIKVSKTKRKGKGSNEER